MSLCENQNHHSVEINSISVITPSNKSALGATAYRRMTDKQHLKVRLQIAAKQGRPSLTNITRATFNIYISVGRHVSSHPRLKFNDGLAEVPRKLGHR